MKRFLLTLVVIALYVSHQDFWNWRRVGLVGFVPVGLWYHALFVIAAALVMWMLVTYAWPAHLEEEVEARETKKEDAR